jgi:hypothetical protein
MLKILRNFEADCIHYQEFLHKHVLQWMNQKVFRSVNNKEAMGGGVDLNVRFVTYK